MNTTETKPLTWRELKEFINSIPEEQLDKKVYVVNPDVEPVGVDAYYREPIYYNKHDHEDVWFAADYEIELKVGNIEFPEDYIFSDERIPLLTTDL